jgi:hypothetical protein
VLCRCRPFSYKLAEAVQFKPAVNPQTGRNQASKPDEAAATAITAGQIPNEAVLKEAQSLQPARM